MNTTLTLYAGPNGTKAVGITGSNVLVRADGLRLNVTPKWEAEDELDPEDDDTVAVLSESIGPEALAAVVSDAQKLIAKEVENARIKASIPKVIRSQPDPATDDIIAECNALLRLLNKALGLRSSPTTIRRSTR